MTKQTTINLRFYEKCNHIKLFESDDNIFMDDVFLFKTIKCKRCRHDGWLLNMVNTITLDFFKGCGHFRISGFKGKDCQL